MRRLIMWNTITLDGFFEGALWCTSRFDMVPQSFAAIREPMQKRT